MLFKRNKNKKDNYTNPLWLKWAVMAFIAYAVFTNYSDRQSRSQTQVLGIVEPQTSTQAAVPADLGAFTLPAHIKVTGDIEGKGAQANCGQKAEIRYTDMSTENPTPQDISLRVGGDDALYPWSPAVNGMQKGGVRQVQLYENKTDNRFQKVAYKIELNALTPHSGSEFIAFQATDRKEGYGSTATCGLVVDVTLKLRGADGTSIYGGDEGEALTFTIGQAEQFYGLDRGVLGMKVHGERTLLIPPAFAVNNETAEPALKAILEKGNMLVAEVKLLEVRKK